MRAINLILAGGKSTRMPHLPKPKQFSKLYNDNTLLQNTIDRNTFIDQTVISINQKYVDEVDSDKYEVILEPSFKGTAAAIALACFRNPNETFIVSPSDHKISGNYEETIEEAIKHTTEIVLLGIKPTKPSTQYGYINNTNFKEKPNKKDAISLIADGYLWNSGISIFNSDVFLSELLVYNHELFDLVYNSYKNAITFDGMTLPEKGIWNEIDARSVDYEILEKTNKLKLIEAGFNWSDVGSGE